jgi:hypothetical protein
MANYPLGCTLHLSHMNRREHLEKAKGIREYVRWTRILTQIETAVALARTAEVLHYSGSKENANKALALAWESYARAVNHLKNHSDEITATHKLTTRVLEVRTILERLLPLQFPHMRNESVRESMFLNANSLTRLPAS